MNKKINFSIEGISLAKAIKAASADGFVTSNNEETKLLTENWDKLTFVQLRKVYPFLNWTDIFEDENKEYTKESMNRFLEVCIPYVEKYRREGGLLSSIEHKSLYYLLACMSRHKSIPKYFWSRLLGMHEHSVIRTFFRYQCLRSTDIANIMEIMMFDFNTHDMEIIVKHQNLSESFMETYSDKLDWNFISRFQNFSDDFILRNCDKLFLDIIEERYYENASSDKSDEASH